MDDDVLDAYDMVLDNFDFDIQHLKPLAANESKHNGPLWTFTDQLKGITDLRVRIVALRDHYIQSKEDKL